MSKEVKASVEELAERIDGLTEKVGSLDALRGVTLEQRDRIYALEQTVGELRNQLDALEDLSEPDEDDEEDAPETPVEEGDGES